MDLRELGESWNKFGKADPMWAILSLPEAKFGRWDPEEFFANGRAEIADFLTLADRVVGRHGAALRRGRSLDFGCGIGRLTQAMCLHFDRVDGVDIAPSMIDQAREWNTYGDRCEYHLNTVDDLSIFDAASFDFVYTAHVLQHMEQRYQRRYVAEFARILAPGGVAMFELVTVPVVGARSALPDDAFAVTLKLSDVPAQMQPGESALVGVQVRNDGSVPLPAAGDEGWFLVTVANHWRHGNRLAVVDDGRTRLPRDIPPGESLDVELQVTAPPSGGSYRLEVDCVQEGVAWFADRGSRVARADVVVKAPSRLAAFRSRAAPSANVVAAHDSGDAVMEMHGSPEPTVREWIDADGLRLLETLDWDELVGIRSYDWKRRLFLATR
ncbi:MAG: methyltransferase domain-containing protein [Mycobacteriales bacterium]|nr:MAG: hypothetical protein DLM56_04290 [Pseudonocardiales bacterium]